MTSQLYKLVDFLPLQILASHMPSVTNVVAGALSRPHTAGDRVGASSGNLHVSMSQLMDAEHRPFHHKTTIGLQRTSTRSTINESRCPGHQLGRSSHLAYPPLILIP